MPSICTPPSLPPYFPSPSLRLSVSSVPRSPPGRAHPKGHRRLVINPLSAFGCSPCPWVCGSLVCSRGIVAGRPIPPVPPVSHCASSPRSLLLSPEPVPPSPEPDGRLIPRAGHAPAPHCVCCPWTRPCPGPAAPHLIRRSETPGPQGPHPYGPGPRQFSPLFLRCCSYTPCSACPLCLRGHAGPFLRVLLMPVPFRTLLATHSVSHCFRMTRPIGPPGELFLSFRCVIVVTHPLPSLFPSLDGRVRVCVLPSYANASHLHPSPPPFSSEEMIVSSQGPHASPPRVRAPRPPSPSPRLLTQIRTAPSFRVAPPHLQPPWDVGDVMRVPCRRVSLDICRLCDPP